MELFFHIAIALVVVYRIGLFIVETTDEVKKNSSKG